MVRQGWQRGGVALLCGLLALTTLGIAAMPTEAASTLVVRRADEQDVVLCRADVAGQSFSLIFTHSMYGGQVIERYVVNADQTMTRTSITTDNAGAAEYYGSYGEVIREAGRYKLRVPPLQLAELRFIADSTGDHRLRVGGRERRLAPAAWQAEHLVLRIESLSPANEWRHRC